MEGVTEMVAIVFWLVVVALAVGSTRVSRRRRLRRIERYAASSELRGLNIDGHERSNSATATGSGWTSGQHARGY